MPSRLRKGRLLMPVRAFVDDSGSGGDSRYFVLGGFMADFDTWAAFADAWDIALAEQPAIEYFKMAEANSLNGEFDGWTELSRDAKVNALIDIIDKHDLFQGTCAINSEDYDAVVIPAMGSIFEGEYSDPYLYLFTGIVAHFSAMEHRWEYAQRGVPSDRLVLFDKESHTGEPPQKVDFVFDIGKKLTDRKARTLYDESLKKLRIMQDRLGTIEFKDDKDHEFVPLQAADLAAWQRRRRLCARQEATRPEYERLHRRPGRFKHTMLTRGDLVDIVNNIADGLRRAIQ
jgi:hypothetical protein